MTETTKTMMALLYIDTESSTQNMRQQGYPYLQAQQELRRVSDECAGQHPSNYTNHTGDGSLFGFSTLPQAIECACDIQRSTSPEHWNPALPLLSLRMGIHIGEVEWQHNHIWGDAPAYTRRIMDAANGRQIYLSETVKTHWDQLKLSPALTCESLGKFALRDLLGAVPLYRLNHAEIALSSRAPRVLPHNRHNLPQEERPFVGRRAIIEQIAAKFHTENARLVTLTGLGGIGKSRLGKQIAAELCGDYADGAWLIEVERLNSLHEIVGAIVAAVPFLPATVTTEEELRQALSHREMLLLLDCFEGVMEHREIIERLLCQTQSVHCLVTSRDPTFLGWEYEIKVEPLQIEPTSRQQWSESMTLFEQNARRVVPGFCLGKDNRALVGEICTLLEGIPLAIVLAAPRLRSLKLHQLQEQLKEELLLPPLPGQSSASRHATMEGVIKGSYQRLSPALQVFLHQLSVFSGSFRLEDVQDIVGIRPLTAASHIDELSSLLQTQHRGEERRFRLWDTVREYLLREEKNEAARTAWLLCCRNHTRHYAALATQIEALMQANRWQEGTQLLQAEINNLRSAIAYSIEQQQSDLILTFAAGLCRVFVETGLWADFDLLADASETIMAEGADPALLSRLLSRRAQLAHRRGQGAEASRLLRRRLEICRRHDDTAGCADSLFELALLAQERGVPADAHQLLEECVRMAHSQRLRGLIAIARAMQAEMAFDSGNVPLACQRARHALSWLKETEDNEAVLHAGLILGSLYPRLNEQEKACNVLLQSLRVALQGDRVFGVCRALVGLGEIFAAKNDLRVAVYALTAATQIILQPDSRHHAQAEAAWKHFRQIHGSSEVQQWHIEARNTPWQEVASQCLCSELTAQIA